MRRRRSGEKYRSLGEDDFSSEDGGPLAAFRMTIFPDGNREEKSANQSCVQSNNHTRSKLEMYLHSFIEI